jgi:hypothetical protein
MVKKITVSKLINDKEFSKNAGKFFNDFKSLINYDCDIYKDNGKLLLKFRKGLIPKKYCDIAFQNYEQVGFKKSVNRGNASGRFDNENKKQFRKFKEINKNNKQSKIYEYGNESNSGIIGYMDSLNWKNPCRETAFTKNHFDSYKKGLPFIQKISTEYKNLLPNEYSKQFEESKKSKLIIDNTVFSTVTINANFRTALHTDRGDYKEGFGNLSVIEKGKYQGGYTLFPQYGIAVDVRTSDILFMDVHEWHCNSEIKNISEESVRLSFVCYLRGKMRNCKKLNNLLKGQQGLSGKQKIDKMLGNKKTKKKNLGSGNYGHKWYSYDNKNYNIKYYNKLYTIIDKKTKKKYTNLTYAFKDYLDKKELQ